MRHVKLRPGTATNTAALSRLIEAAYSDIKARVEHGWVGDWCWLKWGSSIAEKGCPTRRGFRRVGTMDLAPLVTRHRLHSRSVVDVVDADQPASLLRRGISSLHHYQLFISEERCWARRRIVICF
jgi:hypothetical protein